MTLSASIKPWAQRTISESECSSSSGTSSLHFPRCSWNRRQFFWTPWRRKKNKKNMNIALGPSGTDPGGTGWVKATSSCYESVPPQRWLLSSLHPPPGSVSLSTVSVYWEAERRNSSLRSELVPSSSQPGLCPMQEYPSRRIHKARDKAVTTGEIRARGGESDGFIPMAYRFIRAKYLSYRNPRKVKSKQWQ